MIKHSDIRYPSEIGLVSRRQKEEIHISKKKGRQIRTKIGQKTGTDTPQKETCSRNGQMHMKWCSVLSGRTKVKLHYDANRHGQNG